MIQESNLVKTILKDEEVPRYASYYDAFVDHFLSHNIAL